MKRVLILVGLLFMQASSLVKAAPLQQDCSGVAISSPRASGDPVRGRVNISGSASIPNFQFYKVEYAPGRNPPESSYRNIAPDVHRTAVVGGLLDVWDTAGVPDGAYALRLTVVDIRGNFPCPPVVVQPIIVANRAPVATNTPIVTPTEVTTPTVALSSAATRPAAPTAPTIVLPTSAARSTSAVTATAALTQTTRPLISFDFLPDVTQALLYGVCGMGVLLAVVGIYAIARYILDQI